MSTHVQGSVSLANKLIVLFILLARLALFLSRQPRSTAMHPQILPALTDRHSLNPKKKDTEPSRKVLLSRKTQALKV